MECNGMEGKEGRNDTISQMETPSKAKDLAIPPKMKKLMVRILPRKCKKGARNHLSNELFGPGRKMYRKRNAGPRNAFMEPKNNFGPQNAFLDSRIAPWGSTAIAQKAY